MIIRREVYVTVPTVPSTNNVYVRGELELSQDRVTFKLLFDECLFFSQLS